MVDNHPGWVVSTNDKNIRKRIKIRGGNEVNRAWENFAKNFNFLKSRNSISSIPFANRRNFPHFCDFALKCVYPRPTIKFPHFSLLWNQKCAGCPDFLCLHPLSLFGSTPQLEGLLLKSLALWGGTPFKTLIFKVHLNCRPSSSFLKKRSVIL